MTHKSLIIDANNILHRTFFARLNDTDADDVIGLCHHSALWTLQSYYREYPADEIVMAFDSHSWRKLYTKDLDQCVTHQKYKGQRRKNLTPKQQELFVKFDDHVNKFYEIIKNETSILTLKENYLEADDLIALYIQNNPDMKHTLITADKDYMQLLFKNDLTIIDPDSKKPRSLKDWNDDPDLFLFEKCIRGDTSDNIISAYPRLRRTKLLEAYSDDYKRENLMNHTFNVLINNADGTISEKEYLTRDVFEENEYLIDLTKQSEMIRTLGIESIKKSMINRGKFNYMNFLKFCKNNELKNILQNIDNFVPMLSAKNIRI